MDIKKISREEFSTLINGGKVPTQAEIIRHVAKYGKHYHTFSFPYAVTWKGKNYLSEDPCDLVVQICKDEGVEVPK